MIRSLAKKTSRLVVISIALATAFQSLSATPPGDFYDEPGVRLLNQPITQYKLRRERLMEKIKDGIVVVLGNVEEDNGVESRYRQNNWMAYLTGVRTPGSAVMLVPQGLPSQGGAREYVFIPRRNLFAERWTGVQLAPGEEAAREFGVQRVLPINTDLFARIKEAAALPAFSKGDGATSLKVYTIAPPSLRDGSVRETQFVEQVKKQVPGAEVLSVANELAEMRTVKSDSELNLLQRAIDITGDAQQDIAARLKPGMMEYGVQSILEATFSREGSEKPGFPSIVGSGLYSTILHYSENHKQIDDGDLVVCDIGAEYSLYTADITRTYPANGKFTKRQREVYDLVLAAQTAAADGYKPGMRMSDLFQIAADVMRKSPLRARDNDGAEYTLDHFFIHALSHYLGMDVHDVGNSENPLQPGAVFTIEPGIYIQNEKLGVRIEDDYVVTPDHKLRKMSAAIPSKPQEIEKLLAEKRL